MSSALPDRRAFVKTVGATALGAAGLAAVSQACRSAGARGLDRIGIQLYTLRGEMGRDFEGTLARVAEIGYDEVEFAGYFDRSPQAVRQALDANGLRAPATHVSFGLLTDGWDEMLEAAGVMGHRYVVVPAIPTDRRQTLDGYRAAAEAFNRAGERARAVGLRFGYHNHAFEFAELEDRTPYDVLLEECDAELVEWEMDLFWITRAGRDPIEYFERYPGRFPMVHVKDMDGIPDGAMVDVGQGTVDFAAIFARRALAGIQHFFVEHDQPLSAFETARRSYEYLRRLEF